MTALGVLLGLLAAAWVVALCHGRVRRLHRLHIRVDAARAGLDAALARRAAAAARAGVVLPVAPAPLAVDPPGVAARAGDRPAGPATGEPSGGLATPASVRPAARASTVPGDPEVAANALSRALARLDRDTLPDDVREALVDAEQLLVLARRVHNDAVRDTLGLRSRRLVRWLRLAGTAPMPAYFEIADPPAALTYDRVSPSQE